MRPVLRSFARTGRRRSALCVTGAAVLFFALSSACASARTDDAPPAGITATITAGRAALDAGDETRADALAQSALALAVSASDRLQVAVLFARVGEAHSYAAHYVAALADFAVALPMFDALDKPVGRGHVLQDIGLADAGLHHFAQGLIADTRARDIHHTLGDRVDEALDWELIATANAEVGQNSLGLTAAQTSLSLYTALGDASGQADADQQIAQLQSNLGHPAAALQAASTALAIVQAAGRPSQAEAALLRQEGAAFHALGQQTKERDADAQSRAVYHDIGDRDDESQLLFVLGFLDNTQYRYVEAAGEFENAVAIERVRGDRARLAARLESLGGVYGRLYRYDDGLRAETESLQIATALRLPDRETTTLNELGLLYADRAHYSAALDAYNKALALNRVSKNALGLSDALNNIGNIYEDQGAHAKAAATLEDAIVAARAAGTKVGEAAAHLNAAIAYTGLGRHDRALGHLRAALAAYHAEHDRGGEAATLADLGAVYAGSGRNPEALDALARSRSLLSSIGDARVAATQLANLAVVESRLGQYDRALADHQAALALARTTGDRRKEATALTNIALLEEHVGALRDAQNLDEQARSIDREIGDRHGEASALGGLSTVYRREGRAAAAVVAAHAEFEQMHELGDPAGEAAALASLGSAQALEHRCDDELGSFTAALEIARQTGDRESEAVLLGSIASADQCLRRWQDARSAAGQSSTLARALLNPQTLAYDLFTMAVADINDGRRAIAVDEADAALRTIDGLRPALASTADRSALFSNDAFAVDFDLYTQYLATLAVQAPHGGYGPKAFDVFERRQVWAAIDEFGSAAARRYARIPDAVSSQDAQLTRQVETERTWVAKVRLATAPDRHTIDLAQSSLDASTMQLRALQKKIKAAYPRYYELEHPQITTVATLQHDVLRPHEALLAYDVLPDGIVLWIVDRTHFRLVRLPRTERIGASIDAFVRAMNDDAGASSSGTASAPRRGYELYGRLVPQSIRPIIAAANHLIVIPSGALSRLPWETLVTRAPSRDSPPHFLIEDVAVSYVPSATLLALTRATGRDTRRATRPLLAFADPDFTRSTLPASAGAPIMQPLLAAFGQPGSGGTDFAPLPGTRREAEAVRAVLDAPAGDVHTGADASRETLLTLNAAGMLHHYRYLLFATHAVIPTDRSTLEPSLVMAHTQSDRDLTMSDVLSLTLDADFVALSACDTGGGEHPAGEGISGLTRAFLYAGTPALSVTLWEAADQVGPILSPAFFAGMRAGRTPAAALQRAKLALIHGRDPRLRRPYFWAPTVIFGDGGATILPARV